MTTDERLVSERHAALQRLCAADAFLLDRTSGVEANQRTANRVFGLHVEIARAETLAELAAGTARLEALERAIERMKRRKKRRKRKRP